MVERYHLVLAGWAFLAGLVIAAATCVAPAFLQRRLIALAGPGRAVLGSGEHPRARGWAGGGGGDGVDERRGVIRDNGSCACWWCNKGGAIQGK